jgi:GTP-binding protein LepA
METSAALGFGFRCGFLGLLHLEIIQERLEREFNLDLIATAPSVIYKVQLTDGTVIELHNPADMPDRARSPKSSEPWIKATDPHGARRLSRRDPQAVPGPARQQIDLTYVGNRAMVVYELPLNEVVFDFYDRLKSVSKGYASSTTQIDRLSPRATWSRCRILVNGEPVDALSMLVHRDRAEARGRGMVREAEGSDPAAHVPDPDPGGDRRQDHRPRDDPRLRKDVTAKCYGGDATRKRKLLDKQKAGKKRMRQFGKVDIPQEAFIAALKMDSQKPVE